MGRDPYIERETGLNDVDLILLDARAEKEEDE